MGINPGATDLKGPLGACLWITDKCNLACRYCYAMPFSGQIMDATRALSLIDEIAELDVFDVTISGGEPLLHPAWPMIVSHALDRHLNVSLLTNGTLIDEAAVHKLNDVVKGRVDRLVMQISLDGVTAHTHDRSRGQGQRVLDAIDLMCEQTDITLQLASVLNKYNMNELPMLIETYYPRIKRFHILELQRTKRSALAPDLFPSQQENREFIKQLDSMASSLPPDVLLTNLEIMKHLHGLNERKPDALVATLACTSCCAGWTHVDITANFDVVGCDIAKDFTVMGNVRSQRLQDVWRSLLAESVRKSPFPPCYLIPDANGVRLIDEIPAQVKRHRMNVPG
jgi:MoaA/NifB/PqqE/SkfB family radical SAM enzyme